MPLWSRAYMGLTPKPGSTILVQSRTTGAPVVLYQRVGTGKSLLIATDATWVWGFGSATLGEDTAKREAYARFWAQTVRWLATRQDASQVTISLGDSQFWTGQTLSVAIRVYDTGLVPAKDASVQLTLASPDGGAMPIPVSSVTTSRGTYQAQIPLTQPGPHELSAVAVVRGVSADADPVRFDVETPRLEFAHVARNDDLLESIAHASRGKNVPVRDAPSILPLLAESNETRTVSERRALWDSPFVLIGTLALLGSEWAFRKRKGLV